MISIIKISHIYLDFNFIYFHVKMVKWLRKYRKHKPFMFKLVKTLIKNFCCLLIFWLAKIFYDGSKINVRPENTQTMPCDIYLQRQSLCKIFFLHELGNKCIHAMVIVNSKFQLHLPSLPIKSFEWSFLWLKFWIDNVLNITVHANNLLTLNFFLSFFYLDVSGSSLP